MDAVKEDSTQQDSPPPVVQHAERKMNQNATTSKDKRRRRRSSSLMYQEPPESLEQQSDQAILPNLNAQWVNAKGELPSSFSPSIFKSQIPNQSVFLYRRLANPLHLHPPPQNPLRHRPLHLTGDILDPGQHHLHVRNLSHVPLRPRYSL